MTIIPIPILYPLTIPFVYILPLFESFFKAVVNWFSTVVL